MSLSLRLFSPPHVCFPSPDLACYRALMSAATKDVPPRRPRLAARSGPADNIRVGSRSRGDGVGSAEPTPSICTQALPIAGIPWPVHASNCLSVLRCLSRRGAFKGRADVRSPNVVDGIQASSPASVPISWYLSNGGQFVRRQQTRACKPPPDWQATSSGEEAPSGQRQHGVPRRSSWFSISSLLSMIGGVLPQLCMTYVKVLMYPTPAGYTVFTGLALLCLINQSQQTPRKHNAEWYGTRRVLLPPRRIRSRETTLRSQRRNPSLARNPITLWRTSLLPPFLWC